MGPEESSTESAIMPDEVQDLRKSLERALGDVAALRADLSAARDEIDQLKAENAKLRADPGVTRSDEDVKIGQKREKQGNAEFDQKDEASTAVSAVHNGDVTPNRPSDEENSAPSADNDVEEGGHLHKTNNLDKENGSNDNAPSDEDEDEDGDDNVSDSGSDEESRGNGDDKAESSPQSPPTSPADDIRLRAARTLIWADSAIKRAEAMKDQQQQQQESTTGTPRGSIRDMSEHSASGMDGNAPLSAGSRTRLPATVQIADPEDSESDDDSVLSEDDYSARGGSATRRAGPLANFRQFIEDTMDDVADRLVPLEDDVDGGSSSNLPPLSPTNLKYCNEAMKRKLNGASGGGDDADSRSTTRTPVSVRTPLDDGSSCADGTGSSAAKPKPIMNEAMMRLSSEKKKKGLSSRLFSS
mmetsp:Transcript_13003/g.28122  ORF Transcript_13003/g.28122 Transcript_13003/m.28122 type:complete len:414 (+) Transcript_13003:62-1303(+)